MDDIGLYAGNIEEASPLAFLPGRGCRSLKGLNVKASMTCKWPEMRHSHLLHLGGSMIGGMFWTVISVVALHIYTSLRSINSFFFYVAHSTTSCLSSSPLSPFAPWGYFKVRSSVV